MGNNLKFDPEAYEHIGIFSQKEWNKRQKFLRSETKFDKTLGKVTMYISAYWYLSFILMIPLSLISNMGTVFHFFHLQSMKYYFLLS